MEIQKKFYLPIALLLWWLIGFIIPFLNISYKILPDIFFKGDYYGLYLGLYVGIGSLIGLINNWKYGKECPLHQFQLIFLFGIGFGIISFIMFD